MFNIFRKKKQSNMQAWEYELLKAVVDRLPPKYSFLKNQINVNFILDIVPNELLGNGWKRIIVDFKLYSFYKNKGVDYKIIGINILNTLDKCYKELQLDVYDGIIIGYKLNDEGNFDLGNINIENVREINYENEDRDALKEIMGIVDEDICNQLDIDDTFKIEVPEGDFYMLKDLADGNYLSMDMTGAVYIMIHDPYEIEKIYENKESFYKDLKSGNFNIINYYIKKMS